MDKMSDPSCNEIREDDSRGRQTITKRNKSDEKRKYICGFLGKINSFLFVKTTVNSFVYRALYSFLTKNS